MQQIVDLQNNPAFQDLNVALVSIAFDSAEEQHPAAIELGITNVPMAVDADHSVSEMYDVLQWAVGTGEPGHTFVLVDADGIIVWIQDYGAKENGGSMYVEPGELVERISENL